MIGPAIVLAAVFAVFHASAYVFIRGTAGSRVPAILAAAFVGAWAGDALGARLGTDPVRIGDFHVIAASILAWVAMGVVAVVSILASDRRRDVDEATATGVVPR